MDITQLDLAELRLLLYALLGLLALTVVALAFLLSRSIRRRRPPAAPPPADLEAGLLDAEPQAPPQIRLERDPGSDRLVVEVQGKRYHRLPEIEDPELRRQVMQAAAELVDFAGVVGAGEPTLLPPDAAVRWREDLHRATPRQAAEPAAEVVQPPAQETGYDEAAP